MNERNMTQPLTCNLPRTVWYWRHIESKENGIVSVIVTGMYTYIVLDLTDSSVRLSQQAYIVGHMMISSHDRHCRHHGRDGSLAFTERIITSRATLHKQLEQASV